MRLGRLFAAMRWQARQACQSSPVFPGLDLKPESVHKDDRMFGSFTVGHFKSSAQARAR